MKVVLRDSCVERRNLKIGKMPTKDEMGVEASDEKVNQKMSQRQIMRKFVRG